MSSFKESIGESAADQVALKEGSVFYRSTLRVAAGITQTAADITLASTGGDLLIEDIILKTDQTTGIAACATLKIISNNAKGTVAVMLADVDKLGAGTSLALRQRMELNAGDVKKVGYVTNAPYVLESGKKLQIACNGSNCTGTGTIDVIIKFRRMADDADILMA